MANKLDLEIINSFQKINEAEINKKTTEALGALNRKIIVLDDDPTGVQTVHDISVFTDWSRSGIEEGFAEKNEMFFILTNSRSLDSKETRRLHAEAAQNIEAVSQKTGMDYILISRGDSTLRGHYPVETATLKETIELNSNKKFDGEIICPFFKEGGRFTIRNIHYLQHNKELLPVGETEFAKDKTFGYESSHLGEWIEEKSKGEFKAAEVTYISLEDLRNLRIDQIKEDLMKVEGFNKVVVNAVDYVDLKVFSLGLIAAIIEGKRFMFRSAAAIPKVLGNVGDKDLLTRQEMVNDDEIGGLIVIGSHVKKTSEQLEELRKLNNVEFIEFNQHLVLNPSELEKEVDRVVAACEGWIRRGKTVAVFTRRKRLDLNVADKEAELKITMKISHAVTGIVRKLKTRPKFIIAKGGITSSEIGTKALLVKKARVMGQIRPGIPVWETDAQSKFGIMPYIIFPGNVGTKTTLKEVAALLIG